MLVESGLIEPEQEPTCVHGYLQAHLSASSGTGGSGAGVWELHELVLSEFIEALSRVAVKVIDGSRYKELCIDIPYYMKTVPHDMFVLPQWPQRCQKDPYGL